MVVLFVACLTSLQHAVVLLLIIPTCCYLLVVGFFCICCQAETEVADETWYLTQSQYTDTGPASPSINPMMPDARQGSYENINVLIHLSIL